MVEKNLYTTRGYTGQELRIYRFIPKTYTYFYFPVVNVRVLD